jgi:hypothetical protein
MRERKKVFASINRIKEKKAKAIAGMEGGKKGHQTKKNCKNSIIKERERNHKKSLMYVRGAQEKSMAYGYSNKQPGAVS